MRTVFLGMPVWVWLLLIGVGGLNELILKSKWTEAKSIWQGLWRTILWVPAVGPLLARFPWVGPLLKRFAGIEETGLPLPASSSSPPPTSWILLLFFSALTACGGLKPYYVTLTATESIVSTAAQRFPDFDKAKRAQIIRDAEARRTQIGDAKSEEEGKKALAAWDDIANKIVSAVNGADAAVKLAKDGLRDVAAGIRSKADLVSWIGPVLNTAKNLRELLASVGFVLPGVK